MIDYDKLIHDIQVSDFIHIPDMDKVEIIQLFKYLKNTDLDLRRQDVFSSNQED